MRRASIAKHPNHDALVRHGVKSLTGAAEYLTVHPRTVQRLAARGDLAYTRVGCKRVYPVAALEAYLARNLVARG